MYTRESKGESDWEDQDLLDKSEAAERIREALEDELATEPRSALQASRVAALKARLHDLQDQARGAKPNTVAT
jgi:polyhydroxyalkanoate synthesis regulator phasin